MGVAVTDRGFPSQGGRLWSLGNGDYGGRLTRHLMKKIIKLFRLTMSRNRLTISPSPASHEQKDRGRRGRDEGPCWDRYTNRV